MSSKRGLKGEKSKRSAKAEQRQRERAARAEAARREKLRRRIETRLDRLRAAGRPLIAFFEPLGLDVDLDVQMDADVYTVDGTTIRSLGPSEQVAADSWGDAIDGFVTHHLAQKFVDSVQANAAPLWPGARAYYAPSDHGFTLAYPDAEVGFVLICPTHAQVFYDGPRLVANYLLPGRHWESLKGAIERHELKRRSAPPDEPLKRTRRAASHQAIRVPLRVLSDIPASAPRALVRSALEASRRVRLKRQMVYAAPVVLEADFGRIRFEPIEGDPGHLVVPFHLTDAAGDVEGGLVLSGSRDPLRVELYRDDLSDDAFTWSVALRGYADLTTWDLLGTARRGHTPADRSRSTGTNPGSRRGTSARIVPRTRPRPSHTSWPAHLSPLGDTAVNLAAYVAGHRRLLPPGWKPTPEARERAHMLGIRLEPDETWVRPHVRGTPTDHDLRFAWEPR